MSDWKDDKNLGSRPWNFSEQPNKFGYLNNRRWVSNPIPAVDYSNSLSLEPQIWTPFNGLAQPPSSDQHVPCGHWHKEQLAGESPYVELSSGFYQPSVDIFETRLGVAGIAYKQPYGIVAVERVNGTWYALGSVWGLNLFTEPHTFRLSSTNGPAYFFFSGYAYDEDYTIQHGGVFKFSRNNMPVWYGLWESDRDQDGIPYDVNEYMIYNVMDCVGDKISAAALVYKENGVTVDKWQIKTSVDAGSNWTEWYFPTGISAAGSGYHHDLVQIRISQEGTIWAAYKRSAGTGGVHNIELWKSTNNGQSFTKQWETDFYSALGNDEASYFSFDISDADGQNIMLRLIGYFYNISYTQLVYYSTNYGSTFNLNTTVYNWSDTERPYTRGSANLPYIVHGSKSGNFLRSTDYGSSWNVITNGYLTDDFVDQQKYNSNIIYTECGEEFDLGYYNQAVMLSLDNGATWETLDTELPIVEEDGLTLAVHPGYKDTIVSPTNVQILNTQTGEITTWSPSSGMAINSGYRSVLMSEASWGLA